MITCNGLSGKLWGVFCLCLRVWRRPSPGEKKAGRRPKSRARLLLIGGSDSGALAVCRGGKEGPLRGSATMAVAAADSDEHQLELIGIARTLWSRRKTCLSERGNTSCQVKIYLHISQHIITLIHILTLIRNFCNAEVSNHIFAKSWNFFFWQPTVENTCLCNRPCLVGGESRGGLIIQKRVLQGTEKCVIERSLAKINLRREYNGRDFNNRGHSNQCWTGKGRLKYRQGLSIGELAGQYQQAKS